MVFKRKLDKGLVRKYTRIVEAAAETGAQFLVFHFAGSDSRESVLAFYKSLPDRLRRLLVAEIDAAVVARPDKYMANLKSLRESGLQLCLDTAHLFSSGLAGTGEQAIAFLKRYRRLFSVLHLNDQLKEFGKGQDQHAGLLEGQMMGSFEFTSALKFISGCLDYFDNIILEFADLNFQTVSAIRSYKSKAPIPTSRL